MNDEKKVVVWSMVVLFLGLAVVYSLAYLKNAPLLEKNLNTIKENAEAIQQLQEKKEENSESDSENKKSPSVDLQPIILTNSKQNPEKSFQKESTITTEKEGEKNETSLETGNQIATISSGSDSSSLGEKTDDTSNSLLASPSSREVLSGTSQFFGILDILDILGVAPEKIFKDSKGIYYASFGKEKIDVGRTVNQLGGSLHIMATEKEILDNQLFGDKITYINLPTYKNKLVFMLIELDGETRFLQVPYSEYHKNKAYFKSLFI